MTDAAKPGGTARRPLSMLRRYLHRAAPSVSSSGLRQSRRLEGQLSGDVERKHFTEVVLAVPCAAGEYAPELRVLCSAITKSQWDAESGKYPLRLVVGGTPPRAPHKIELDSRSTGSSLLRRLVQRIGDNPDAGGAVIDKLPKFRRDALVVIVRAREDLQLAQGVLDRIALHPRRQVVWVDLADGSFGVGAKVPRCASEAAT